MLKVGPQFRLRRDLFLEAGLVRPAMTGWGVALIQLGRRDARSSCLSRVGGTYRAFYSHPGVRVKGKL